MKKITLIVLAVGFTTSIFAQDTTSFSFEFNHLTLVVKDLDRSADFYKNVLLLGEINNRSKEKGMRWLSMGGVKELHISTIGNDNIIADTSIHFALSTSNFEGFINRLQGRGIRFTDSEGRPDVFSTRADGVRQLYFQDPDGYWIEVNNIAPRNR